MGGVMSLKKGDGEFEFFSFSLKEKESEILYFGYFYISSRGRRIIVGMCVCGSLGIKCLFVAPIRGESRGGKKERERRGARPR
jgi:hypothetical protein